MVGIPNYLSLMTSCINSESDTFFTTEGNDTISSLKQAGESLGEAASQINSTNPDCIRLLKCIESSLQTLVAGVGNVVQGFGQLKEKVDSLQETLDSVMEKVDADINVGQAWRPQLSNEVASLKKVLEIDQRRLVNLVFNLVEDEGNKHNG